MSAFLITSKLNSSILRATGGRKLNFCILKKNSSSNIIVNNNNNNIMAIKKEEIVRFIRDCMVKAGASYDDSIIVAEHLMTADYRGHFSHGMNRLPMYLADIQKKLTDPKARPVIISDFKAIALVDGKNGLGQVIGKYSMNLAIEKAKKYGIGMISTRGSNHYGICGYYTMMASNENLIGFSCTNTSPLQVPTRSKKSALGTNPLSLAMKSKNDEFVLDMATTAVALGKIEIAARKGEDLPDGWALGHDGKITNDPIEAQKSHRLLPLGGVEKNSGYKGYGLAVMVEILCGILSGSQFGPNIRDWKAAEDVADLGQCFLAINPEVFCPGAPERLDKLLGQLRELPVASEETSGGVMVAGDPERKSIKRADQIGGIIYHDNQIKACNELADSLGVIPLQINK